MRQILVDYARRHRAAKRGAGVTMVPLEDSAGRQPTQGRSICWPWMKLSKGWPA